METKTATTHTPTSKCGCDVIMDDYSPDHGAIWLIERCPLHEAAAELLAALKLADEGLAMSANNATDEPRRTIRRAISPERRKNNAT